MLRILFSVLLAGVIRAAPYLNDVISSDSGNSLTGCLPGSTCVAFNLCKDKNVIRNGLGLLDVRYDDDGPEECLNFFEVCCKISDMITPTTTMAAPPELESCGNRNIEAVSLKITGDDSDTHFAEFPWMVAVLTEEVIEDQVELNVYQCGGSLIHPKIVMTAAHCVFGRTVKSFKVRAGEWDTQTKNEPLPHQDRYVSDIIIHEHYSRHSLHNDIALLVAESQFQLAVNVKTVCLPPPKSNFDYSRCSAAGWGKNAYGQQGKHQDTLRKVDLPIIPHNVCEESLRTTRLGYYFELHPSFVCAGGEKDKDTCKGDGGSPLVCPISTGQERYYQIGIVAWGIGCGDDIPAVYANIAELRHWIDRQFTDLKLENKYYIA